MNFACWVQRTSIAVKSTGYKASTTGATHGVGSTYLSQQTRLFAALKFEIQTHGHYHVH